MSFKFLSAKHRSIYVAAYDEGNAATVTIETLKGFKLPWTAKGKAANDLVASICQDYVLGRSAARLGFKGAPEETAIKINAVFAKKAWKPDAPVSDKYRTRTEHLVIRASQESLRYVCEQAGKPASKAGNKSGNRGANKRNDDKAGKSAESAGIGHNAPNNPSAMLLQSSNVTDYVKAYGIAEQISELATKLFTLAEQNKVKLDDLGTLLRDFAEKFKALPKAAEIVKGTSEKAPRNDAARGSRGK